MRSIFCVILTLSVIVVWGVGQASAQPLFDFGNVSNHPDDIYWEQGYGVQGINGRVNVLTDYDGLLIAGGLFDIAGDTIARNIVGWDGSAWVPLGSGTDGEVHALAVYGDLLIVGGEFGSAGSESTSNIAAWDGASWSLLGSGVDDGVLALAVWDDHVFAGGEFSTAGGISARRVAAWNGTHWSALGSDFVSWGTVRTLTVHGDQLFAGGPIGIDGVRSLVAAWNGVAWSDTGPLGDDEYNNCTALAVYGGQLIASSVYATDNMSWVHRWDGSAWSEIYGRWGDVRSLAVYGGSLIATSPRFTNYGGQHYGWTEAWNGSIWSTVASIGAYALTVHDGLMVAGGSFSEIPGGRSNNIAAWNGSTWFAIGAGSTPEVSAFAVFGDELIVGGSFASIGDFTANKVAAWDGVSWSALGSGPSHSGLLLTSYVTALTVYDNQIIIGGLFNTAGGAPASNIAAWDGVAWSPLGAGIPIVPADAPDTYRLRCLTTYRDDLVAGGDFPIAGEVSSKGVAAWDGTSWRNIGFGGSHPYVYVMTVYDGRLVVAGYFSEAGGEAVNSIAAWDGTAWSPLGLGLSYNGIGGARVYGLAEHEGRLVACGSFNTAGDVPVPGIAAWDNDAWTSLGPMDPCSSNQCSFSVAGLTVFNNLLIAGGWFTELGGVPVNRIASWDGSTWSPLGSGLNEGANALIVYDSRLWVGGKFTRAGDKVSAYLAVWDSPDEVPVFITGFGASAHETGVDLFWDIVSDEEILGYRIYRSVDGLGQREDITRDGLISPDARTYRDERVSSGRTYEYSLAVVLTDRSEVQSQTVTVQTRAAVLALHQNHPNPFNPTTTISFALPERVQTRLSIYDITGKRVATLVDHMLEGGLREVTWNGRDDRGNPVSSGVYFYRLTAGKQTLEKKMVFLK